MKNVKIVVLTLVAVLLSAIHTHAFYGLNAIGNKLYTQDTLVPEPLASDNVYREAKLWFLPDYQKKISAGGVYKPTVKNNCSSFSGDGSGRTYIESPDLNLYNCSGSKMIKTGWKCAAGFSSTGHPV